MTNIASPAMYCPHCKTPHPVPTSRNRFKCKNLDCRTFLQINRCGDALHDFFNASGKEYMARMGIVRLKEVPFSPTLSSPAFHG